MLQPYDQETDKTKHKFMVQSIFINNKLSMGPIDNYVPQNLNILSKIHIFLTFVVLYITHLPCLYSVTF